jgi:type I restriction enzyme S subunit
MTAAWMENLELLAEAPDGIKKLRELILELAVRGKLVPQDPSDEPASELLKRIAAEKARLVKEGKIKKQKPLAEIGEEEKPFELPVGWEWTRFGSVCAIRGELVRPEDFPDLRQVAPDCIEKGTGHLTESRTVKESGVKGPNSRFFAGQLLYSKIRPSLSKAVLVDFDGLCSADMYPLDSFIDPVFLLKEILSEIFLEQVRVAENRIKMPKLNQDSLSSFVLPIPPLAEQHRIVAKVDELMTLCDRLEARQADAQHAHARLVQALLDSLTQARDAEEFQAAWERVAGCFEGVFSTENSVDDLRQVLLQLAIAGKLVRSMTAWKSTTLGSLGTVLGGATPSKANPAFWSGDIPWVSPKDMKRPLIDDAADHISPEAIESSPLKLIPVGSLLMVVRGMILAHSFPVALTTRPVTINQDMKALSVPKELAPYLLLYLQASKNTMVGLVDRSSHGTCKLVSEKLWSLQISLPPLEEQARILAKVTELLALCDQLKARIVAAQAKQAQLAEALVKQAVATAAG